MSAALSYLVQHTSLRSLGTNMSGEEQDSTLAFGVMGPLRRCGQGLQRAVGCLGRRTKLYNRAENKVVCPSSCYCWQSQKQILVHCASSLHCALGSRLLQMLNIISKKKKINHLAFYGMLTTHQKPLCKMFSFFFLLHAYLSGDVYA